MHLIRTERRTFTGLAKCLADDESRAKIGEYVADMVRPYGMEPASELSGYSYGEMGEALVAATVPAAEPVDLLVLAFSIHDLWPGRATATYLSHLCPGTPLSFAICDQGSAAAFTGLRVIRDYRPRRAMLIVVEQATLPYESSATLPAEHRGVALLLGDGNGSRVVNLRQHSNVTLDAVADLAAKEIIELSASHRDVRVVLSDGLATAWSERPAYAVVPPGQPTTGVWWQLAEALTGAADLVVAADYDPDLRYLCLAGVEVR